MHYFSRAIAYGTERYPEKVARRLRAVNIICWCLAAFIAAHAIRDLIDPATFKFGLIAVVMVLCFASIPLLHRFNSAAAVVALTALTYFDAFRVAWAVGTAGGNWLGYFVAIALVVLLLGIEHFVVAAILAAVAGGLVIALHLLAPYNTGELSPDHANGRLIFNVAFYTILLFTVVAYAAWTIERAEAAAEQERERSDSLLANILPARVAEQLKRAPGKVVADRYDEASVLFADMAGFTARAGAMTPEALVAFLDRVFSEFDRLVESRGVEKIKTSGDSYMVVSGVPAPRDDHADAIAGLALDMLDAARRFEDGVSIRIGIATGPVVAGVVGSRKFFYDVWGDTVNVASRMETTGEPGRVQVSETAYERLRASFILEPRGAIEIKGKGSMQTWFLVGRKSAG